MNKSKIPNPRTKAKNKYNNANYAQLNLRLHPKIVKGLKIYCNNVGISQRELISQLIYEKIERDTGKSFDEFLKKSEGIKVSSSGDTVSSLETENKKES